MKLLKEALVSPKGLANWTVEIDEELLELIARYANGDARAALNTLEMAVLNGEGE